MSSEAARESDLDAAFEHFRAGFPALKEKTYLSVCDKMILHDDVRRGIEKFLDHLSLASANRVDPRGQCHRFEGEVRPADER